MRYFSGSFTHMQPIEIQHMQSQRTMHVDKSQRPRLGHTITKLHLTSSLTFSKQIEHSRTSHFPRVHAKIWILTSLLSLFLLRKVIGSSLESSSQVHPFTHPKERQNPTQKSSPYLIFLAAQTESPAARRKPLSTLSSSLPLILSVPATRKGILSCKSTYIYIYIYICCFKKLWSCVGDLLKID